MKELTELQSQIVDSPKAYQSRLDELQETKNKKLEERNEIQEAIQDKKENIKQINEKLAVVQKINDEFSALEDTYKDLKYFIYICYHVMFTSIVYYAYFVKLSMRHVFCILCIEIRRRK